MAKNIFKLYEEGNSAKEISSKLSIPLSTVYFHIKKLKLENSVSKKYDISLADIDRMKRKIDSLSLELDILKSGSLIREASKKDKLESMYQLKKNIVKNPFAKR